MIVTGARGDYCGSEDFLMKKLHMVRDITAQYEDEIGRIKLKSAITEKPELAEIYLNAFSTYDSLYTNNAKQNKCVQYIKICLENIINAKEVNKLLERYTDNVERIKLKLEIKNDKELTQKYVTMFKMLENEMPLSKEQLKCYKFIKFYGKKF